MRVISRIALGACLLAACGEGAQRRPEGPGTTARQGELPAPTWTLPEGTYLRISPQAPPPTGGGGGAGTGGQGGEGGLVDPGTGGYAGEGIALEDVRAPLGADPPGPFAPAFSGMGGGVAMVDLDGDGDLDLLVGAELGELRAYRNQGGMRFRDDTAAFGLAGIPHVAAFALGDCNADGELEIVVSRSDSTLLLRRGIAGKWTVATDAGLGDQPVHGLSAELLDLDGDGDLDLLQSVYQPDDNRREGEPPRVFSNDGACRFTRAAQPQLEAGMGVDFGLLDADGDGDPDLLMSNDFGMLNGPTRLYRNDGGAFRPMPSPVDAYYGMGATVADLDADGRLDVYVCNIGRNPWYRSEGPLTFRDRSAEAGIGYAWYVDPLDPPKPVPVFDPGSSDPRERDLALYAATYTSGRPDDEHAFVSTTWSANAVDLDADGWLDLFLTNGRIGASTVAEGEHQRLVLFRGSASGWSDASSAAGLDATGTFKGSTAGDLDGDRRPDLLVFDHRYGNPGTRHRVLRNASARGNWIRVQLEGRAPNTWGLGAVVQIQLAGRALVQQRSLHQGVYSASADAMFFGIRDHAEVDVKVTWPWKGGTTVVKGVRAFSTLVIKQP